MVLFAIDAPMPTEAPVPPAMAIATPPAATVTVEAYVAVKLTAPEFVVEITLLLETYA